MTATPKSLKSAIADGEILLVDGAVGTELYNRGVFINRCFEDANLRDPQLLGAIHREYLEAGAQILTTNSWGANRFKLRGHNLHDRIADINHQAVEIAREAADGKAWVMGSVGPLGVRIEPFGPTSFAEARQVFAEHCGLLNEAGADALVLETFLDITEIEQAIEAAHTAAPDLPLIALVSIRLDGHLPFGTPVEWAMRRLDELGVDMVGLNCCVGPQPMRAAIDAIRRATSLPICLQPNAGLPKAVDGRQIYMSTPEYLAHFCQEFVQSGVQWVGGCCGTSPAHIKAMKNAMRQGRAMEHSEAEYKGKSISVTSSEEASERRIPLAEKSRWSAGIAAGGPVYSVELLPPPGADPSAILQRSRVLKEHGVDAINIPDGPRASARMSAILTSVMIEKEVGIETVLHYTCRDRNLLGMQSDMLGAHAIGLRNMLLITGDPPKLGNYPDATGVFDVDAIGLVNMVHRLNGGRDLGQKPIGDPLALSIGVGVNPVHRDFEYEMRRFAWKVEAGAEWAITQPVFDVAALERFMDYLEANDLNIPIVAGIWPLTSYRNALFMHNEVPGVEIPDETLRRMEEAKDPEASKRLGVEIARDIVKRIAGRVAGIQVSAPFGRVDLALNVIDRGE